MPTKAFMMEWKKIKELHEKGHIIGSHTLSHPNLAHTRKGELRWELTESKRVLEKELCTPVIHFSYPNPALWPQYTEETTAAVKENGFETAVISSNGPVRNRDDPLLLERLSGTLDKEEFLWNVRCTMLGRRV